MKRRDFITLLGGAATAWPLAAHAQQGTMPTIGFLDTRSPEMMGDRLRTFRQGLKESGYVERENVTIEYRWAEGQLNRVPELAAELVRRPVAATRSTQPLPPSCGLTDSSSVSTNFSSAVVRNWSTWRHATRSRRHFRAVSLRKSAG